MTSVLRIISMQVVRSFLVVMQVTFWMCLRAYVQLSPRGLGGTVRIGTKFVRTYCQISLIVYVQVAFFFLFFFFSFLLVICLPVKTTSW